MACKYECIVPDMDVDFENIKKDCYNQVKMNNNLLDYAINVKGVGKKKKVIFLPTALNV